MFEQVIVWIRVVVGCLVSEDKHKLISLNLQVVLCLLNLYTFLTLVFRSEVLRRLQVERLNRLSQKFAEKASCLQSF